MLYICLADILKKCSHLNEESKGQILKYCKVDMYLIHSISILSYMNVGTQIVLTFQGDYVLVLHCILVLDHMLDVDLILSVN